MIKSLTLYFTLGLILTGTFGCDYIGFTKIKEITDNPLKFEGKEVKVKGIVEEALRIPLIDEKSENCIKHPIINTIDNRPETFLAV
jgi:hypothetical protein